MQVNEILAQLGGLLGGGQSTGRPAQAGAAPGLGSMLDGDGKLLDGILGGASTMTP